MALIDCSECGNRVSDKAQSCPNCGNPINKGVEPNGEYLCCPKCLSKELHVDKKGFSGTKAFVGAIATGGIGLLAGTHGSRDIQITCLKCGATFEAGDAKIFRKENETEYDDELRKIIESGGMLAAVKYYRDKNNCDLSTAKYYVDSFAERNSITPKNGGGGCAGAILLFLLIIISFTALSFIPSHSVVSEESRRLERIIEVPEFNKNELYVKINSWFVQIFNSSESVIEFQDKENGKIMGKYVFPYTAGGYSHYCRQTISVDIKDGRVRMIIDEPYYRESRSGAVNPFSKNTGGYAPLHSERVLRLANKKWTELANSLESHIKVKDEW